MLLRDGADPRAHLAMLEGSLLVVAFEHSLCKVSFGGRFSYAYGFSFSCLLEQQIELSLKLCFLLLRLRPGFSA